MKYCRYCGCPLEDDAVLCTKCGTVVTGLPQTTQRKKQNKPAQPRKRRSAPNVRVSQQTADKPNGQKPKQRKPRQNQVEQSPRQRKPIENPVGQEQTPRQRKPRENPVAQEQTPRQRKPRQRKPRENPVGQEQTPRQRKPRENPVGQEQTPRQRKPRENLVAQEQTPKQRKPRQKAPPKRQREQEEIVQEPTEQNTEQPFIAPLPKLPKFIRVLFKIMFVVVAVCGLLLGGLSAMHVYTARLATPKLEDVEQTNCYAAGFSEYFEDGEWEYSFIKNRVVYKAEIDNKHYEFVFKVKIFRSANVTRITQDKKPLDQNKQSVLLYDIFT